LRPISARCQPFRGQQFAPFPVWIGRFERLGNMRRVTDGPTASRRNMDKAGVFRHEGTNSGAFREVPDHVSRQLAEFQRLARVS
jgi:hypothetical protein